MPRYIDADALIADIKRYNQHNYEQQDWRSKDVVTLLEECPYTVDVAPVVCGEWMTDEYGAYICSRCGGETGMDYTETQIKSAYCPNCGAKMTEVYDDV